MLLGGVNSESRIQLREILFAYYHNPRQCRPVFSPVSLTRILKVNKSGHRSGSRNDQYTIVLRYSGAVQIRKFRAIISLILVDSKAILGVIFSH